MLQVEETLESLKKNNISKLYTGPFNSTNKFLGMSRILDDDDYMTSGELNSGEIKIYESNKIEVIVLDTLI